MGSGKSVSWRPIGAGVCLMAAGRGWSGGRMRQVQEGFGPNWPSSQQRQLQGLLLVTCDPLPAPSRLISLGWQQMKLHCRTLTLYCYKLTLQLKASQARPDIHILPGGDLIRMWWEVAGQRVHLGKPHLSCLCGSNYGLKTTKGS